MSQGSPPPLKLDARGMSFAICAARWNAGIVDRLLEGAQVALKEAGASTQVYRCPGAFELAPLCGRVLRKGSLDGVIALGCLIRGGTDHYRVLADDVIRSLGMIALEAGIGPRPAAVTFGVLTCETERQAEERAGKGAEFARACIEQVVTLREVGP